MTIKELIENLERCKPDMQVEVQLHGESRASIQDILVRNRLFSNGKRYPPEKRIVVLVTEGPPKWTRFVATPEADAIEIDGEEFES